MKRTPTHTSFQRGKRHQIWTCSLLKACFCENLHLDSNHLATSHSFLPCALLLSCCHSWHTFATLDMCCYFHTDTESDRAAKTWRTLGDSSFLSTEIWNSSCQALQQLVCWNENINILTRHDSFFQGRFHHWFISAIDAFWNRTHRPMGGWNSCGGWKPTVAGSDVKSVFPVDSPTKSWSLRFCSTQYFFY